MKNHHFWIALLAGISLSLAACQSQQTTSMAPAESARPSRTETSPVSQPSSPVRDLSQDEAEGGHTLRKHVDRSDEELRERLRHERNITAASTWTDRAMAEQAVGSAIAENQAKIDRWLNRANSRSNLVIDYDGDPSHPIGRTLNRDADQTQPCSHAVVVLKRSGDRDYFVLTSYPECRS